MPNQTTNHELHIAQLPADTQAYIQQLQEDSNTLAGIYDPAYVPYGELLFLVGHSFMLSLIHHRESIEFYELGQRLEQIYHDLHRTLLYRAQRFGELEWEG